MTKETGQLPALEVGSLSRFLSTAVKVHVGLRLEGASLSQALQTWASLGSWPFLCPQPQACPGKTLSCLPLAPVIPSAPSPNNSRRVSPSPCAWFIPHTREAAHSWVLGLGSGRLVQGGSGKQGGTYFCLSEAVLVAFCHLVTSNLVG